MMSAALRVSRTTLDEIDQRISDLESLLHDMPTRADLRLSEERIIGKINELKKVIEWERSLASKNA